MPRFWSVTRQHLMPRFRSQLLMPRFWRATRQHLWQGFWSATSQHLIAALIFFLMSGRLPHTCPNNVHYPFQNLFFFFNHWLSCPGLVIILGSQDVWLPIRILIGIRGGTKSVQTGFTSREHDNLNKNISKTGKMENSFIVSKEKSHLLKSRIFRITLSFKTKAFFRLAMWLINTKLDNCIIGWEVK